jgi:flagellar motor switch protein FliN
MSTITPGTPLYSFVDLFRKPLGDVLSEVSGTPWTVTLRPEDTPPSSGTTALCFEISLSGSLRGKAAFQMENAEALLLAKKLVPPSGDAGAELNPARKQAIEQVLRKITAQVAAASKDQFGEVDLQLSGIEVLNWTGTRVTLVAVDAASGTLSIGLRLDTELLGGLSLKGEAATAPRSTETPAAKASAAGDNNLDLLLGVELNLTLRFGQRTLTLREILDLSSGSIIELDRQVQEPADLLLGDKLIARGEVVVVDGNYGLRIKEMCDPPTGVDKVALYSARSEACRPA